MLSNRVVLPFVVAAFLALVMVAALGSPSDERARVEVLDRSGKIVGWAYEDELTPPMPSLLDARDDFEIGAKVSVHGSNGKLVGHIVRGTGFVPLRETPS